MNHDRFLEVKDARLRYRDEGAGPAVVLLHGWTLDLDMWEAQVSALGGVFRLVRFDRRGCGLSSGTPSLADDAGDVQALCRHLGIQRAAFVGMSQGARVLHHLAGTFTGSIGCLVFDGAPDMRPAGNLTAKDVPFAEYAAVLRNEGIEAFRRSWAAHPLTCLRTEDPTARELLSRMLRRYAATDLMVKDLMATAAQVTATPAAPRLEDIHVPALVINGEFDLESRRLAGEALSSVLPRAERQIIGGAGHLANLDNPQNYNDVLRRFLQRYALVDGTA